MKTALSPIAALALRFQRSLNTQTAARLLKDAGWSAEEAVQLLARRRSH